MAAEQSLRAILYAFLANFGIAIAKTAAALLTGSGSLLAEALHSLADCGNQVLLYIGLVRARKPPDARHPLGYGKESYFWSFIVALLLFSFGGLFSLYEGWSRLSHPEPIHQPVVGLAVLLVATGLEAFSLLGCLREIQKLREDRPLFSWLRTTRNAELVVVFGEDVAALIGLVFALFALTLTLITGEPVYDAIGSMMIGGVLIFVALFIALRMRAFLIGIAAEPRLEEAIRRSIKGDPVVQELLNLITLRLGPDVMVAAKVALAPQLPLKKAVEEINRLERELQARFPEVRWTFIEPDFEA